MSLEIECKIYFPELAAAQHALAMAGAELVIPRVFEQNVRYESPNQDFVAKGIVLRLRRDQAIRLTYKSPAQTVEGASARLELETTVGDFAIMEAILQHLGFYPCMTYEKYRTTYHLPDVADTEIVLDEMPFGTFIEVEGAAINTALSRLGLAASPRILASYSELFERVRQHYNLTFNDLTFQNFAGLIVTPEVLESS